MMKIYQLTSHTDPFASDGFFRCRVGFEKKNEDGTKAIRGQKKCPILRIPHPAGTVSTANPTAQMFLESFVTPARSKRGGQARSSGPAFTEITDTAVVDVELDPIFDKA